MSSKVDSDNKMTEFLYEYQKRKMTNLASSEQELSNIIGALLNYKTAILLLPLFVVIGGIYYIVTATYIGSVFLWGDFVEHSRRLTERRKLVWNAVVIALLIGIVGNLFVLVFSQYISPA